MSIFANKKDLEAAQSQINSLQGDITTLEAELVTERDTVATQAQSITDLQASLDSITAERETLTASLQKSQSRVAELAAAVVSAEQSAETKAVTLLASAGHDAPIEIAHEESPKSIREQINAIPDAAKRQEARLKNWDKL